MNSENKFFLALVVIVCTAVLALILGITSLDYLKETRMAELGFQKTSIVGSGNTFYQKIPLNK